MNKREKYLFDIYTLAEFSYIFRYFNELQRRNYVTPTSYLELIKIFKDLLDKKRLEIIRLRERYVIGIEKLELSENQIAIMQKELNELKPKMIKASRETEELIVVIEKEALEVDGVKQIVEADTERANKATMEAQFIKDECEEALDMAMPALNDAVAALNTLKPQDISAIKTMQNPPAGVRLVMEAVCIMKGIKAERKTDGTGKTFEDYWSQSKKVRGKTLM